MKHTKEFKKLGFIIITLIILFLINQYLTNKQEIQSKEIEKINMLASCYKGCQFATQPAYGITPIDNINLRIKLYDNCSNLCEVYYK